MNFLRKSKNKVSLLLLFVMMIASFGQLNVTKAQAAYEPPYHKSGTIVNNSDLWKGFKILNKDFGYQKYPLSRNLSYTNKKLQFKTYEEPEGVATTHTSEKDFPVYPSEGSAYIAKDLFKKGNNVYALLNKNNISGKENKIPSYINITKMKNPAYFIYHIDYATGQIIDVDFKLSNTRPTVDNVIKDIPGYKALPTKSFVQPIVGDESRHSIGRIYYADSKITDINGIYTDFGSAAWIKNEITVEAGQKDELYNKINSIKSITGISNIEWFNLNNIKKPGAINDPGEYVVLGEGITTSHGTKVLVQQKVNVITPTVKDVDYTINYVDENGKIIDSITGKDKPGNQISVIPKDIPGYESIDNGRTETLNDNPNDNIFTIKYKKKENLVDIKILHKFGTTILRTDSIKAELGTTITKYPATDIKGYTSIDGAYKELKVIPNGVRTIIFEYKKENSPIDYKVIYKHGDKILHEETKTGNEGDIVREIPKNIEGYVPVSNKEQLLELIPNKNLIIEFQYEPASQPVEYEIHYVFRDKVIEKDRLIGEHGEKVSHQPKKIKGYTPLSINSKELTLDKNKKNIITFEYKEDRPIEDILDKKNHNAYIYGYPNDTVRPTNKITRAEVASVFYRLLTDNYREEVKTTKNNFSDVKYGSWYNEAISTLVNANILNGYSDGKFRPNQYITRAELATIASKFDRLELGTTTFKDTKGHWAEEYISSAAEKGWVNGYKTTKGDYFRPNNHITRAEFVTLTNNVLDRHTTVNNMLPQRLEFKDLKPNAWYYEDMQEAINSHTYIYENGKELWITLEPIQKP